MSLSLPEIDIKISTLIQSYAPRNQLLKLDLMLNLLFQNSNGLAQKIHGPLEKVVWYAARDVTAGATGATMAAPELSDALILFQPSGAACAQHRTNNIPVATSLAALLPEPI